MITFEKLRICSFIGDASMNVLISDFTHMLEIKFGIENISESSALMSFSLDQTAWGLRVTCSCRSPLSVKSDGLARSKNLGSQVANKTVERPGALVHKSLWHNKSVN